MDIENLLKNGADKIAINTAAIKKPDFIDLAVKEYGSSTITISAEVKCMKTNLYVISITQGANKYRIK